MKLIFIVLLTVAFSSFAALNEQVFTAKKAVKEIRVQNYGMGSKYYFVPESGTWQATGCENTIYAYLDGQSLTAKAAMSMALASKTTNKPISCNGTCGNESGNMLYIKINYITF